MGGVRLSTGSSREQTPVLPESPQKLHAVVDRQIDKLQPRTERNLTGQTAPSNVTSQTADDTLTVMAQFGNEMALSLAGLTKSMQIAVQTTHPCLKGVNPRAATRGMRARLDRLFNSKRNTLWRWDHGFQSLRFAPPGPTTGEDWGSVNVVDPVDLLAVASVAWACAISKGEMRVAGLGGPLPPEGPVLSRLLGVCTGPVRGIRLRAPGYNVELPTSRLAQEQNSRAAQEFAHVTLPVAELGNMLQLNRLGSLGLWGYALLPQPTVALDLPNVTLSQLELHSCTRATVLVLDGGESGANGVELHLSKFDTLTELHAKGKRGLTRCARWL